MWANLLNFLVFVVAMWFVVVLWSNFVKVGEYSFVRNKSSTFECGFEPKDCSRQPFSLRFFLMMIVFLVFDMELCLLLNFPLIVNWSFMSSRIFYFYVVVLLLLGVYEEWRRGILYWK